MFSKQNLSFIIFFILPFFIVFQPLKLRAQHEELKQSINAFVESKSENFEKKYLNQTEPDYGELANTNFTFHDYFQLKAKERTENSLGNKTKVKYNCSFYAYENATERDYALSFWFKNFIEDRRITPGREVRTYKGAEPTIIIMNATNVCVINFSCYDYDPEAFRDMRKELLAFFGNAESMVIEIQCDGPLKWTKNPPDPKDRKWRM